MVFSNRKFFDLLDPNIKWTISGHSTFSKIYNNKEVFIAEVIKPLNERLSVKIKPSIRNIYAEKDTVVVLWDGVAVAKDGKPYINSYAWFLKMKNGKIVEAVAFFDTADLEDIFNRIQ
jgi:ketosteroid isomerase-like protein